MDNVTLFPSRPIAATQDQPRRVAIRRRSDLLATALTVAFALAAAFTLTLAMAALLYDGPLLSFGPGGLWIGRAPDPAGGRVALSTFAPSQRLAGAVAICLLTAPIMFILHEARGLFRLYADGIVFAFENARRIKFMGVGLILYSAAPFVANRVIMLAGVTSDPIWFHLDEVMSLIFGALAFVIGDVMEFGREIEQERDGFV